MKLYRRDGNSVDIHWEPEYADLGEQAIESVVGSVEYPVHVSDEKAAAIREEYQRLISEKRTGES